MSILNSASSKSVYRGYEYYKNNNVITYTQISEYEYEGYVKGKNKEPYHVIINIKHPKKSSCDCLFANGNTICKHMVSLFFQVSPDDLKDYEDWYENDYDSEDDYYDEYEEDYYNDYEYEESYSRKNSNFIKPVFFDEILKSFVNELSVKEAKDILLEVLMKDEESTYNTYLKDRYKKNIKCNNIYAILENLNEKIYKMSHDYDYNYKDYKVNFLSKKEKEIISEEYISAENIKGIINNMFLNPELAVYDDYKWFATLYKNENCKNKKDEYIKKLESFFNTLKHYSIKNTIPKSNILIILNILNNYNIEEKGKMLVENCRYSEYVEYIINNEKDINKLYISFKNYLEEKRFFNYENIAKVFYEFYVIEKNCEMYNESIYYNFFNSKDIRYLNFLKFSPQFDYYINRLLNTTKDVIALEKIYITLNKKEELLKLLLKKENESRLISNIEILKDEYNNEIHNYLKDKFYEMISVDKNRQIYHRACSYVCAICKLNNGNELVNNLINELKNSEYSKRTALFDEIYNAIK